MLKGSLRFGSQNCYWNYYCYYISFIWVIYGPFTDYGPGMGCPLTFSSTTVPAGSYYDWTVEPPGAAALVLGYATMLNLLMRSKAFCTLRLSGLSAGSIPTSFLSKPLHLAILSRASMDRLINYDMSLILVSIFASEFFSINLKSSP